MIGIFYRHSIMFNSVYAFRSQPNKLLTQGHVRCMLFPIRNPQQKHEALMWQRAFIPVFVCGPFIFQEILMISFLDAHDTILLCKIVKDFAWLLLFPKYKGIKTCQHQNI